MEGPISTGSQVERMDSFGGCFTAHHRALGVFYFAHDHLLFGLQGRKAGQKLKMGMQVLCFLQGSISGKLLNGSQIWAMGGNYYTTVLEKARFSFKL